jgi:hypothetical protein
MNRHPMIPAFIFVQFYEPPLVDVTRRIQLWYMPAAVGVLFPRFLRRNHMEVSGRLLWQKAIGPAPKRQSRVMVNGDNNVDRGIGG